MIPVCRDWLTDLRGRMPGAIFSIGWVSFDVMAPLPSMGRPSASTTRPSRALPTGTESSRPVVSTVSPSLR